MTGVVFFCKNLGWSAVNKNQLPTSPHAVSRFSDAFSRPRCAKSCRRFLRRVPLERRRRPPLAAGGPLHTPWRPVLEAIACLSAVGWSSRSGALCRPLPGAVPTTPSTGPRTHWPAFVRGDCGFGNEGLLGEAEARGLPCLLKLRHSAKVRALVQCNR